MSHYELVFSVDLLQKGQREENATLVVSPKKLTGLSFWEPQNILMEETIGRYMIILSPPTRSDRAVVAHGGGLFPSFCVRCY